MDIRAARRKRRVYTGPVERGTGVGLAPRCDVAVPHDADPVALAGVADNVTTAMAMVAEPLLERPGSPILILGGLAIGLNMIQFALALGADKVVFVDTDPQMLRLARRMGAEVVNMPLSATAEPVGQFPITIDGTGEDVGLAYAALCADYDGICLRTYGGFEPPCGGSRRI